MREVRRRPPGEACPLIKNGTVAGEDVLRFRNLRLAWAEATAENKIPSHDREWKRRKTELSVREAVEAMGVDNVLGPEKAAATFGLDIESLEIPPVPFSVAEIERAGELGQFLVFRVSKAEDGGQLSMKKMDEVLSWRFETEGKGTVLSATSGWCKNDPFFAAMVPNDGWALVSREVVPGTTSKDYLEQTDELIRYLKEEVFQGRALPQESVAAIEEFQAVRPQIAALIYSDSNWLDGAERLEALKITRLLRPSPVEMMYDEMLAYDHASVRGRSDVRTWTSGRSDMGGFVLAGRAGKEGLFFFEHMPDGGDASLGAVFARR